MSDGRHEGPVLRNWVAGLLLTVLASAPATAATGDQIDLANYERTFAEDFDSLDVSPWGRPQSRWIAHTPWSGDFGDAKFANPRPGFPFTIADGILRIEARKGPNGKWESGLLSGNDKYGRGFAQQFGYFEIRTKLPAGKGVWPAFWLIGTNHQAYKVEVDVLEFYGHNPQYFHSVIHIWQKDKRKKNYGKVAKNRVATSMTDRFNTFGVAMDETDIVIYFNRREVHRFKSRPEFHQPMYPLLNLALGAGWPIEETPNPSYMWVDYVHVYRRLR